MLDEWSSKAGNRWDRTRLTGQLAILLRNESNLKLFVNVVRGIVGKSLTTCSL